MMRLLHAYMLSHSVMFDSANPWTVACQAPLVHGILQARILEWVSTYFSGDLNYAGIRSTSLALAGRFFPTSSTWEACCTNS